MNSYRLKKERQRTLFSFGIVLSGFLLIYVISLISGLFKFEDFTDYSGPVKITFGSPDSLIEESTTPDLPVEDASETEVEEPVEPEIEQEDIPEPIPEERVDPDETPRPEPVQEDKKTEDVVTPEPAEPVVQQGRESGNSFELSSEDSSSTIKRSGISPIIYYMPLPKTLPESFYLGIKNDNLGLYSKEENQNTFLKYYILNGSNYILKESVSLSKRFDLWIILEDAGYDLENAEYKEQDLKQVEITFEVVKISNNKFSIENATFRKSSGNSEIDEAVLYGFKQSTYSNSTDKNVKGRFKYSFK